MIATANVCLENDLSCSWYNKFYDDEFYYNKYTVYYKMLMISLFFIVSTLGPSTLGGRKTVYLNVRAYTGRDTQVLWTSRIVRGRIYTSLSIYFIRN